MTGQPTPGHIGQAMRRHIIPARQGPHRKKQRQVPEHQQPLIQGQSAVHHYTQSRQPTAEPRFETHRCQPTGIPRKARLRLSHACVPLVSCSASSGTLHTTTRKSKVLKFSLTRSTYRAYRALSACHISLITLRYHLPLLQWWQWWWQSSQRSSQSSSISSKSHTTPATAAAMVAFSTTVTGKSTSSQFTGAATRSHPSFGEW